MINDQVEAASKREIDIESLKSQKLACENTLQGALKKKWRPRA